MNQCDKKKCKNGIFVNALVMYQFLKNGFVVIVSLDHIPYAILLFFYKYCVLEICFYVYIVHSKFNKILPRCMCPFLFGHENGHHIVSPANLRK